jgi:hypothetical protein
VVDLVDAKAHNLVWRGTACDTVGDNPEKNTKKIEKAAEKMFKKYPPKIRIKRGGQETLQ